MEGGRRLPTFRPAELADLDLLVDFVGQYYTLDHIPFEEQTVRTALTELMGDPSLGRVWLIAREGATIGYLVLTFGYSVEYGGRDAFVDELFIGADYRGQGVGTAALQFAAATCRTLGIRALHLEVERANTTAQRLYRKAGFEDHDRYLMTKRIVT